MRATLGSNSKSPALEVAPKIIVGFVVPAIALALFLASKFPVAPNSRTMMRERELRELKELMELRELRELKKLRKLWKLRVG